MAAAAGGGPQPRLDFRYYTQQGGQEVRCYFTIGAENLSPEKVKQLYERLRGQGFEVSAISDTVDTSGYQAGRAYKKPDPSIHSRAFRQDTHLPARYEGVSIFIQKHVEGDRDDWGGAANVGKDIEETLQTLQQLFPEVQVDPHAAPELEKAVREVKVLENNLRKIDPEGARNFQPQLRGADKVMQAFHRHAPQPGRAPGAAAAQPQAHDYGLRAQQEEYERLQQQHRPPPAKPNIKHIKDEIASYDEILRLAPGTQFVLRQKLVALEDLVKIAPAAERAKIQAEIEKTRRELR